MTYHFFFSFFCKFFYFLFVYSAVNILSITLFHAFGYASDFFLGFICRYVAVSP